MMAALTACVAAAACAASASMGNDYSMQPAPGLASTVVHVENNNWADMDVFVVRQGLRARIGTVTSMSAADLRVPETLLGPEGDLQLMVDPIGSSRSFMTQPMMVSQGQRVRFRVENNLALSSYTVR